MRTDSNNTELKNKINELNERQKELNCLYKIKSILRNTDFPVDKIFAQIIATIPPGWQYPEICRVKIIYNDEIYKSKDLKETELKQSAKLIEDNAEIGNIEVYYIKPVKSEKNPIFLYEEQKLLNTIAEDISKYLTTRKLKDLLDAGNKLKTKKDIPSGLEKWLSGLNLEANEIHKMLSTKISFRKNETVFKQGSIASFMIILTGGLVKAHVEDMNERSFAFKIIKTYEIIGLSSLFGEGQYGFSVSTLTPAEGYLVDKETMKSIIESNTKFNFELLKWYGENFNLLFTKLNLLANKQALGRIANTILFLSTKVFNNRIIENTITRKNIAELSGMSTENAVRILSELKNDGIIKITKSGIEVLDHSMLKTYSMAG